MLANDRLIQSNNHNGVTTITVRSGRLIGLQSSTRIEYSIAVLDGRVQRKTGTSSFI